MEHEFDVIVIGAGPAGEVAAGRASTRGGKKVALIERGLVGGECSFYACMPSKALLRPAQLLAETGRVPGVAEAVTGELDVQAVLDRRDDVISNLDDSHQLPWVEDHGIALFRGEAKLDGERKVVVGDDVLTARDAVVIATGTTAAMPPIPGITEVGAWSNREVTTAKEPPKHLLIIGGGVVGAEMAQAWLTLGSRVTVIEGGERILARQEPIASELVSDALRELGADLRLNSKVESVSREGNEITVQLDGGPSVAGDRLLVAIGRKPLTADLGLETVGLEGGGYLEVDDHLQVPGKPWLYAVGDVNGRSLLTHAGKYQARIAVDRILGQEGAIAYADLHGATPQAVFTDPHVAGVGKTFKQAQDEGLPVIAIDLDTNGSAGASFVGRGAPGKSRFVVDTDREVLVGVTFVGPDIAEWLHAASIAVVAEVPLRTLAHAIAAFPSRSELWLSFLEEFERTQNLTVHSRRSPE